MVKEELSWVEEELKWVGELHGWWVKEVPYCAKETTGAVVLLMIQDTTHQC